MKLSVENVLDKPESSRGFVRHVGSPLDLNHTSTVMCVDGNLGGVTIWLEDVEEESEVKLVLIRVKVLDDIITDYGEAQNRWNVVLG